MPTELVDEFYVHWQSLRRLVLAYLGIFAVAYVITLVFFPRLYEFILSSVGAPANSVYAFGVGDILGFYFTAPAVFAFVVTLPVFLIMFYRWVEDALLPKERHFITRYAKVSAVLFAVGVAVSFFIVPRLLGLAFYMGKLLHVHVVFSAQGIFNMWLSFAAVLGIVFQFPVVISLLIRVGFVSKDWLRSVRGPVYVIFYLLAAIITPGDLLVSDLILFALFAALYEGALILTPEPHRKK